MASFFISVITWVFRSILVKFLILFALFFVVSEFIPVLIKLLPTDTNIKNLFDLLPEQMWYFLNYFKIPTGVTLIISAMLTRFLIRRIPIIG